MIISTYNTLSFQHIKSTEQTNRLIASKELTTISDNIEMSLNLDLQFAKFYGFMVANDPDISEEYVRELSNHILEQNNNIKNIGLAPDGVLSFVYPQDKSQKLIGYNLLLDKERELFTIQSIKNKTSTTHGPLEAIQGGLLVFNREPIFITNNGIDEFWGLATVAVDFHELVKENGLEASKNGYLFSLKAENTQGMDDFFWGHKEIFEKDALINTIELPNQTWEIAIYPESGWVLDNGFLNLFSLLFYSLAFISSLALFFVLDYQGKKISAARKDFLTGTLSGQSFIDYFKKNTKRTNKNHGLITLDVDSFKEINDSLGHPVGDQVLIEVANRIRKSLNKHDQVSRFAGDEFFVFLDNVTDEKNIEKIICSIYEDVSRPMTIGSHTLQVSISAGGALFPKDGTTFNELYALSDKRMYHKKCHAC